MYPNLKLQLWRTGMRQNRLAKLLQMDETVLSKIVNGFRAPDSALRVRIAQALGADEEWLFSEETVRHNTATPPFSLHSDEAE